MSFVRQTDYIKLIVSGYVTLGLAYSANILKKLAITWKFKTPS